MYDLYIDDDLTPNESTPSRMKRDNADETAILEVLKTFKAFEADGTCEQLINIATKDVATSDIQDSLLNAEKLGKEQLREFVSRRLVERDLKLTDTVHKVKAKTFTSLYDVQKDARKVKTEV